MGLPHQELCSKELEKDEEEKGREIHKLYRGKRQKIIKEEAENACARPHSGIKLSVINEVYTKVDNDSMKGDDNNERTKLPMKLQTATRR
jgi:hypothetical protein